jgi:eukaryotic translation initiation factor 2C
MLFDVNGLSCPQDSAAEYDKQLRGMLSKYNIGNPKCISLPKVPNLNLRNLDSMRNRLLQAKDKGANLIVLLLGKKDYDMYASFKYLADCELGLQCICLTEAANVRGSRFIPNAQYMANIMMKVNLKFGGTNHDAGGVLGNREYKTSENIKDMLVLGADVTHPGPGSLPGCPSIAVIVGSVDQGSKKFLGTRQARSYF